MKFFRADTEQSLQAAIAGAEARIVELTAERDAKLAEDGDYLTTVGKIDAEIAKLRNDVLIFGQRGDAVRALRRKQDADRLQKEKAAGVAEIRRRLARRHEAATALDAAVAELARAFAAVVAADDAIFVAWPPAVSDRGRLAHFRVGDAIEPLSARRIPRPPSAGVVRVLAEAGPFNFAATVEARNIELVEMIESATPVDEVEEEAA
jgi:hypothetical protein